MQLSSDFCEEKFKKFNGSREDGREIRVEGGSKEGVEKKKAHQVRKI
jgi:hypothetical protein